MRVDAFTNYLLPTLKVLAATAAAVIVALKVIRCTAHLKMGGLLAADGVVWLAIDYKVIRSVKKPSSDSMPQERSLDSQIKERFEVVETNVKSIEEAEVILFCELHHEPEFLAGNAAAIDLLYNDGDIVLLEERDASYNEAAKKGEIKITRKSQIGLVKKKVAFGFWDDPDAKKAMLPTHQIITHIKWDLKELRETKLTPERGKELLDSYRCLLGDSLQEVSSTEALQKELIDQLERFHCRYTSRLIEMIEETFIQRNDSLCSEIERCSKEGKRRVFVIAGTDHLCSSMPSPNEARAIAKTMNYLNNKKFMVLRVKTQTVAAA